MRSPQLLDALPRALWPPAMDAAAAVFHSRNRFGVFAYGIRRRVTSGRARPGHCLCVFVARKIADLTVRRRAPELHIEADAGAFVHPVDVVGTGARPALHKGPAAALPFSGLHVGAPIVAGGVEAASVGLLLTSTGDVATHLVTAGHVFPFAAAGSPVFAAAAPGTEPTVVGFLQSNLLDTGDTATRLDAALVELNQDGIVMAATTAEPVPIGAIATWKSFKQRSAQAFRWTAGDFGPVVTARPEPRDVHFDATDLRAAFTLRRVYGTSAAFTAPGDSGTALVDTAMPRGALGTCVGTMGDESIFEPLDRSLHAFRQQLGPLDLWSNP
jgi:hypothetical protein